MDSETIVYTTLVRHDNVGRCLYFSIVQNKTTKKHIYLNAVCLCFATTCPLHESAWYYSLD